MARRRTELVKADDADTELLPLTDAFGEVELVERSGEAVLTERPEDVLSEPPDARDISAELSAPPRRKLPWLTLVLSAGVVAAAAFAGGVLVEKDHLGGTSSSGGSAAARNFASAFAGAGGRTGTGAAPGAGAGAVPGAGGGTAASGVTIGTVKLVDGDTIYVTDAQGAIVKVTTGGSTKVTVAKDGKTSDLQPGQSVTVRGSANSSGDIAATTVTEGAAPTGGFGGFGGTRGGG